MRKRIEPHCSPKRYLTVDFRQEKEALRQRFVGNTEPRYTNRAFRSEQTGSGDAISGDGVDANDAESEQARQSSRWVGTGGEIEHVLAAWPNDGF